MIQQGFPRTLNLTAPKVQEYWQVRHCLSTDNSLVLLYWRVAIPKTQWRKVLHCLHSAHQGVVGMKAHTNELVYWPEMDALICSIRANCMVCSNIAPSQPWEPIILTQSPDWPFQQIVMDLFYVLDHAYLACTDRLTGWLILYHREPSHATTSKLMSICWQLLQAYGTQMNSVPMTAHLSPSAYSKNSLKRSVLRLDYPQSHIPNPMAGQNSWWNHKEDSEWKHRTLGFLGQWQCCPGYLAVLKLPNPRYWSITSITSTPLLTPWFHSFTANPLQATPQMGHGSTTLQGNPLPLQCKNSGKV